MKWLHYIAFVLLVVGGLNWGLWAAFDFNLVDTILGAGSMLAKWVYILVGVSAVWIGATHMKDCKICSKK